MDSQANKSSGDLTPLPYQCSLVTYLKNHEPEVWSWASSAEAEREYLEQVRTRLLRDCYRLENDAHADLLGACERVAQRLSIDAPVTLYQANDATAMNAALYYAPGEAHVVFSGPVLSRLQGPELEAVLGHELAHYRLWENDNRDYLVADRIMMGAAADGRCANSHIHTARRLRLYTEIFADRGAYIGSGSLDATVAALVKMATGLERVSAASYLRQADEIFTRVRRGGQEGDHPEQFIRARAVRLWSESDTGVDEWLKAEIEGDATLDTLCLVGQQRIAALTRRLLGEILRPAWIQTPDTLTQAKTYFLDFDAGTTVEPLSAAELNCTDSAEQRYWCYVLLDFARADRELDEVPLAHAWLLSQRLGLQEPFEALVAKELRLNKRQLTRLRNTAAELTDKAQRS